MAKKLTLQSLRTDLKNLREVKARKDVAILLGILEGFEQQDRNLYKTLKGHPPTLTSHFSADNDYEVMVRSDSGKRVCRAKHCVQQLSQGRCANTSRTPAQASDLPQKQRTAYLSADDLLYSFTLCQELCLKLAVLVDSGEHKDLLGAHAQKFATYAEKASAIAKNIAALPQKATNRAEESMPSLDQIIAKAFKRSRVRVA